MHFNLRRIHIEAADKMSRSSHVQRTHVRMHTCARSSASRRGVWTSDSLESVFLNLKAIINSKFPSSERRLESYGQGSQGWHGPRVHEYRGFAGVPVEVPDSNIH
jgi:hypothetical protein